MDEKLSYSLNFSSIFDHFFILEKGAKALGS
jgi:hypothetical protein